MLRSTIVVVSLLVVALAGCAGEIEPLGTSSPPSTPGAPGPAPGLPATPEPPGPTPNPEVMMGPGGEVTCGAPPPARLWRLSHAQYHASVVALLGVASTPASTFEPEATGSGFTNGADTAYVSQALAAQYFAAAEQLAAEAVKNLGALLPCTPADPASTTCVRAFIERTGRRAFRRPPAPAQVDRLLALHARGATPTLGVQMVLEALLQSPGFLYRSELGRPGPAGSPTPLTAYELASSLSFLTWNGPPDDALLDAAAKGELDTQAGVQAALTRLLADPKAQAYAWRFLSQQFHVEALPRTDKDLTAFPTFTPALKASLEAEAHAFVDQVVWRGTGRLSELLTADYSMLDATLAKHYGVSGVSGSELKKVTFPAGQRSGLLTHAGLLAVHGDATSGSPVQRGLFVRERLLCQEIPAPPANVVDTLPTPTPTQTTRGRYQAHLTNASCSSCHRLMDPIGFGFERYDAIGRHRTTENGITVDASGEVVAAGSATGTFDGALALGAVLAKAPEVKDCVATAWFRYALGRSETKADACSLLTLRDAFRSGDGSFRALVESVVQTPAFGLRTQP